MAANDGQGSGIATELLCRPIRCYTTPAASGNVVNGVFTPTSANTAGYEPTNVIKARTGPAWIYEVEVYVRSTLAAPRWVFIFDTSSDPSVIQSGAFASRPIHRDTLPLPVAGAAVPAWRWTPPKAGTERIVHPERAKLPEDGVDYGFPCNAGIFVVVSSNEDVPIAAGLSNEVWVKVWHRVLDTNAAMASGGA